MLPGAKLLDRLGLRQHPHGANSYSGSQHGGAGAACSLHYGALDRLLLEFLVVTGEVRMVDSSKDPGSERFDLDTLRRIVRDASRAQQLRLDTLSRRDIEEIAAELGIDHRDLELAFQAQAPSERETPTNTVHKWLRRIAVGTSGAIAAVTIHGLDRLSLGQPYLAYTTLGTLIVLLCAEAVLTWHLKGKAKHVVFQSVNLALWGGWSGICFFVIGHPEGGIPGIFLGAGAAVLGSVLLLGRERTSPNSPVFEIPATESTPAPDSSDNRTTDNVIERIKFELEAQLRLRRALVTPIRRYLPAV
jgi:hypothetical protein